ncbi:MAG: hypothetical protein D6738_06915 [Acidobacteria bacterium]|nr:MAG: hypothetical protein D6738_06915 [Acidobacteriota bacterium]
MTRAVPLRVEIAGREPGQVAMDREAALARAFRRETDPPPVARGHGWSAPTLTLGRAQDPPADLLSDARESGVAIARRPTGGGWLLHLPGDAALTLVLRGRPTPGEFRATARRVARAIVAGLSACGVDAAVLTGHGTPAVRSDICFARGDRDEVAVGTTKVAGVALARLGPVVLVQAALPLVPARGPAAGFEARWDPTRARAVEALAGADATRLWDGFVAAVRAEFGLAPPDPPAASAGQPVRW